MGTLARTSTVDTFDWRWGLVIKVSATILVLATVIKHM